MLFNARDRQLLGRDVFLLQEPMTDQTWYQLGARRVLFLGSPLPLDADLAEISLAPP
jgi:hypothetical protein